MIDPLGQLSGLGPGSYSKVHHTYLLAVRGVINTHYVYHNEVRSEQVWLYGKGEGYSF